MWMRTTPTTTDCFPLWMRGPSMWVYFFSWKYNNIIAVPPPPANPCGGGYAAGPAVFGGGGCGAPPPPGLKTSCSLNYHLLQLMDHPLPQLLHRLMVLHLNRMPRRHSSPLETVTLWLESRREETDAFNVCIYNGNFNVLLGRIKVSFCTSFNWPRGYSTAKHDRVQRVWNPSVIGGTLFSAIQPAERMGLFVVRGLFHA